MTQKIVAELPHRLGTEEARRRIASGIGRLSEQVPGGAAVDSGWSGNRLDLKVEAMSQQVTARIDVGETSVRVEMLLPAALSFFARPIEAMLKRKGAQLLEDRRS